MSTLPLLAVAGLLMPGAASSADGSSQVTGRKIYEFYCYQCHGYSGDARTLASTYLDPRPRNFSTSDPQELSREQMTDAVRHGRTGTAMVSFTSVISGAEIEAVVSYIRQNFMQGNHVDIVYHTAANGWEDHDRYAAAFPFASGELPLDTPWEKLTAEQQQGRQLYMQACISCHDRATVTQPGAIWELRALSYPRRHYSHRMDIDGITSASPYLQHEKPPDSSQLSQAQQRGAALFQQNCAFCHGADGSGRNWIGSFLEPHARDLTTDEIKLQQTSRLEGIIRNGLAGTSMPAWKHVLDDAQIDDVIRYIKRSSELPIR
jgi:cytochrome c oxidase cbb3-type subunit 3